MDRQLQNARAERHELQVNRRYTYGFIGFMGVYTIEAGKCAIQMAADTLQAQYDTEKMGFVLGVVATYAFGRILLRDTNRKIRDLERKIAEYESNI